MANSPRSLLLFCLSIFCITHNTHGQRSLLKASFTFNTPTEGTGLLTRPGTKIAYLVRTKTPHYIGASLEIFSSKTRPRSIQIPNNLHDNETVYGKLNFGFFGIVNALDLTPDKTTKLFLSNKLGVRWGSYRVHHKGDFFVFSGLSDEIYHQSFSGFALDLELIAQIPIKRSLTFEFATGLHSGASMKYADPKDVRVQDQRPVVDDEKEFNGTLWCNSISAVWRF